MEVIKELSEIKLVDEYSISKYLTKGWKCVGYRGIDSKYVIQKSYVIKPEIRESLKLIQEYLSNKITCKDLLKRSHKIILSTDPESKELVKELERRLSNLRVFVMKLQTELGDDYICKYKDDEIRNYILLNFDRYID